MQQTVQLEVSAQTRIHPKIMRINIFYRIPKLNCELIKPETFFMNGLKNNLF